MAMWRCPHCGTPQAETARCWVCRRSSTSCGTCRHFRASVAANVGYCGLDRQRRPLSGDEIRACWESRSEPAEAPAPTALMLDDDRTPIRHREFVEVAAVVTVPTTVPIRPDVDQVPVDPMPVVIPPRWSLWEDVDR